MDKKLVTNIVYGLLLMLLIMAFAAETEACDEYNKVVELIYFEARNQDFRGQLAVATVAYNRLYTGRWGDTICEVVDSPKQFSYLSDGLPEVMIETKPMGQINEVANCAVNNRCSLASLDKSLYYYACEGEYSIKEPYWVKTMKFKGKVDDHCYYVEDK